MRPTEAELHAKRTGDMIQSCSHSGNRTSVGALKLKDKGMNISKSSLQKGACKVAGDRTVDHPSGGNHCQASVLELNQL